VYQASVLSSASPPSASNGRGERTYTTRFGLRPSSFSETVLRSSDTVAAVTVSPSSPTFGPP
jgi:hypothetical protein